MKPNEKKIFSALQDLHRTLRENESISMNRFLKNRNVVRQFSPSAQKLEIINVKYIGNGRFQWRWIARRPSEFMAISLAAEIRHKMQKKGKPIRVSFRKPQFNRHRKFSIFWGLISFKY